MNRTLISLRLVTGGMTLAAVLALTATAAAPAVAADGSKPLHFATPSASTALPALESSTSAAASRFSGRAVIGSGAAGGLVLAAAGTATAREPVAATQLQKLEQPVVRQPASGGSAWFWLAFGIAASLVAVFILVMLTLTRRPRLAI